MHWMKSHTFFFFFFFYISYKTLIGAKPLRIRLNKINRFIRVYDGTI